MKNNIIWDISLQRNVPVVVGTILINDMFFNKLINYCRQFIFSVLDFDFWNICVDCSEAVSSISKIALALIHIHVRQKRVDVSDEWRRQAWNCNVSTVFQITSTNRQDFPPMSYMWSPVCWCESKATVSNTFKIKWNNTFSCELTHNTKWFSTSICYPKQSEIQRASLCCDKHH